MSQAARLRHLRARKRHRLPFNNFKKKYKLRVDVYCDEQPVASNRCGRSGVYRNGASWMSATDWQRWAGRSLYSSPTRTRPPIPGLGSHLGSGLESGLYSSLAEKHRQCAKPALKPKENRLSCELESCSFLKKILSPGATLKGSGFPARAARNGSLKRFI